MVETLDITMTFALACIMTAVVYNTLLRIMAKSPKRMISLGVSLLGGVIITLIKLKLQS